MPWRAPLRHAELIGSASSDIFSFGLVLYEMSAGDALFGGAAPSVIFEAILNRTPIPLVPFEP